MWREFISQKVAVAADGIAKELVIGAESNKEVALGVVAAELGASKAIVIRKRGFRF
jgi:hypothetical protein